MKTVLIASLLAVTTFSASAMTGDHQIWTYQEPAAGPGKTRAEVIAELQVAKAAGQVNLTDYEMRQADRMKLQAPSTLTRAQVRQEVDPLRQQGQLDIQSDHR